MTLTLTDMLRLRKEIDPEAPDVIVTEYNDVQPCGICGLPTITEFAVTYCTTCHALLCATCRDNHQHKE